MFEIAYASIEKAVDILGALGYTGVLLLSFLDRLTVFIIPAEIVLPAYGILVSRGVFDFWPVFIWVTVGSFFGNLALYFIFFFGGRPFLEKYGKYFFIFKHEIGHLDRWSLKFGNKIVAFGYLLPTSIRSLVPILAGIFRMDILRFSLLTFFMSVPYNLLLLFIGMKVGDNFYKVLRYFERFNYVVLVALIILIIWYVYRHRTGRHLTHE
ncbi:MAG: DedA family protein [Candidatus Paceibacterota bacterium]